MRTLAQKPEGTQRARSAKATNPMRPFLGQSHDVHSILHLQRAIGNQATQRLLQRTTEEFAVYSADDAATGIVPDLLRAPVHAEEHRRTQRETEAEKTEEEEGKRDAEQATQAHGFNREDMYPASSPGKSAGGIIVQMDSKPKGGGGSSATGQEITVRGEEENEESLIQTSQSGSGYDQEVSLSSYLDGSSSGSGKSLDDATNARMSGAFGYDFSKIRIHDDAAAHSVSRSIGANAFTTDHHIYFSRGKYNPGTENGDRLLSHELTHVIQQSAGVVRGATADGITMSTPYDSHEKQADTVADMVTMALHRSPSIALPDSDLARDDASPTQLSLAEAILQRKASSVPELQADAGLTVSIIGVLVSAGTWAAGQGGSTPMTVDPRLERIAEPSEDRERYRSAHPFRHKSWSFFDYTWEGATPISLDRRWMVDLRWQYNGAELTDVHLVQGWESFSPFDSTHAKLIMVDNQASNKRIGFRCEFEWDPAMPGHGLYQCEGWISADGSGRRTAWRWHNF